VPNETILPKSIPLPGGKPRGAGPCAACTVRVLSVCDAIGDEHLSRLAAVVSNHRVPGGSTFVSEGEPADALFNITAGTVKVYKLLADGRQQITGFLYSGDFLGLSSNERYAYSAESITEVRYCRFPRRQLEQLLADFPTMERRLLGIASNELAAAQDQMLLLGCKTAREKLASFLRMLLERAARAGRPADCITLPMTRGDISEYLGVTLETVSRTLAALKREKIIALDGIRQVRLLDRAALDTIAEGGEVEPKRGTSSAPQLD
jgi:CRP/FNR family transcriptional regulator